MTAAEAQYLELSGDLVICSQFDAALAIRLELNQVRLSLPLG